MIRKYKTALYKLGFRVYPLSLLSSCLAKLAIGIKLNPRLLRRANPLVIGPQAARSMIIDYFADSEEQLEAFNPLLGQTVLDIGAHVGAYTILAASQVGRKGKVIAVEPHPENYRILLKNLMLNGLKNGFPVNVALLDRSGYVKLYLGKTTCRHSILRSESTYEKCLNVPCITADELLAKLGIGKVDWIKIDVEGAELKVLNGMSCILKNNPHLNLIVELHSDPARTIFSLEQFGLNVKVLSTHNDRRISIMARWSY